MSVLADLRDQAIVSGSLQAGDRFVVSPLTTPGTGMKVRSLEVDFEPPAIPAAQGAVARQEER